MVEVIVPARPRLRALFAPSLGRAIEQSALREARAQQDRVALWTPVAFGAGAAMHLSARAAPNLALACAVFAIAAALYVVRRGPVALLVALAALGVLAAEARVRSVAAPVLARETGVGAIEGRIVSIEDGARQRRLVIALDKVEGLSAGTTPQRARVSWRGRAFDAHAGDRVRMLANLSPPPPPATPGGFDFARTLYFQRIGAVGFAVSAPEVLAPAPPSIASRIEEARRALTARIIEKAPGDAGAIVAAVVTGKREAISEEANVIFRDSGLAHLLSISGLHMSLATGLVFFFVRASLALIEPIALRYPIKKWAAAAGLASGAAYLAMSGFSYPAQRSFIMTAVFLIAILFDRRALSLRNVAIAALIVLAGAPEAVLHPGFQMSFAAVTALIAWHEWDSARADPARSYSVIARAGRYARGLATTDIAASLATSAYSLYHFHRAANFGLPANMVSMPLMAFVVMPAAIVALILAPFGADGPLWRIAAFGVDIMLRLGAWTSSAPWAVTHLSQWPPASVVALTAGGLVLCLGVGPWRLAGVLALPAAILFIASAAPPRIFIADDGENAAFVIDTPEGRRLAMMNPRRDRFVARAWMEAAGLDAENLPPVKLADHANCDGAGCVLDIEGRRIAVSRSPFGVDDDCLRADLVIALHRMSWRAKEACRAEIYDIWKARDGDGAIGAIGKGEIRIRTVAQARGARPWSGGAGREKAAQKSR